MTSLLKLISLILLLSFTASAQEPKFVYPLPAESSSPKSTLAYARSSAGKDLSFDIYRPASAAKTPVMIMLNGIGADWMRSHPQYTGWGRLATSIGVAGVTMDSEDGHIEENFDALMKYLRAHAGELKIDPEQVIVYSCSANVKAGLPLVSSDRPHIKGAVVYYGSGEVPALRRDLPVLMVRAGLDSTQLNSQIDALVSRALKENAPWELVNFAGGQHGFDIFDDNDESRAVMRRTLEFVRTSLDPAYRKALAAAQLKAQAAGLLYSEKWQEAADAYERLAAEDKTSSTAHAKLAEALQHLGQDRRAIDEYGRSLELGTPNRGLISYRASLLCLKLGDKERALKFVENAKGIKPIVERFRSEPEFATIRNDPRFQAVLTSVQ